MAAEVFRMKALRRSHHTFWSQEWWMETQLSQRKPAVRGEGSTVSSKRKASRPEFGSGTWLGNHGWCPPGSVLTPPTLLGLVLVCLFAGARTKQYRDFVFWEVHKANQWPNWSLNLSLLNSAMRILSLLHSCLRGGKWCTEFKSWFVCNLIQKFSNWKLKTGLSKMKVWREKSQCRPREQEKVVKEKMWWWGQSLWERPQGGSYGKRAKLGKEARGQTSIITLTRQERNFLSDCLLLSALKLIKSESQQFWGLVSAARYILNS